MSDTYEEWKPEDETPGVWTYIDEETGEEVTVPDDDCEHPDEEGGE